MGRTIYCLDRLGTFQRSEGHSVAHQRWHRLSPRVKLEKKVFAQGNYYAQW